MAFPSIAPNRVEFTSNTPMIVTRALNGREERLSTQIPYFNLSATFDNVSATERRQIVGHHASVGGSLTSFAIELPEDIKDNSAGYTGTIAANGTYSAGDSSITVTTSGNGAVLKAGDLITFAGHNKVYQVKADVTATALSATVTIFPALLSAVSDTASITHTDVNATVRYSSDSLGYILDPNLFGSFTIDFREEI